MEKFERNRLIGASIGFVLCAVLLILTNNFAKKQHAANIVGVETAMKMVMEAGYAQGQMDAIKGIIRVKPITDSSCVWVSSPWGTIKPMNDTVSVNILHK